ncbi:MAG TPA: hypothetical protein H9878_05715 [Candidatus Dietzia merdigallinarum]|nr:hypothetical protein [Candidatus Dietzia merdigallinarum]
MTLRRLEHVEDQSARGGVAAEFSVPGGKPTVRWRDDVQRDWRGRLFERRVDEQVRGGRDVRVLDTGATDSLAVQRLE